VEFVPIVGLKMLSMERQVAKIVSMKEKREELSEKEREYVCSVE
jgi:hypothetical protein